MEKAFESYKTTIFTFSKETEQTIPQKILHLFQITFNGVF